MSYEKEKRIEEINRKILVSARNELYLHLRFLDVALSTLRYQICLLYTSPSPRD